MGRLLAYSIVFANILAILLVTLVQPQTAALYRKKMYDTRAYLLAQECTMNNMGCETYMAMMCTMTGTGGTWTPGTNGAFGTCNYNNGSSCNGISCFNEQMCTQYATMYPSSGYYWNGSACGIQSQQGGLGGSSSSAIASNGLYITPVQSQNACLAELTYAAPETGTEKRKLSALGILIERGGMPQSVTAILQDICFSILPSITEGKNGARAFADGSAKKALAEGMYYGLNNAPSPAPDESIQIWTDRVGLPYLSKLKTIFEKLQVIGMSNAYLIDPIPYITDVRKTIDSAIASFSPEKDPADTPKSEKAEIKKTETPEPIPAIIEKAPEQLLIPIKASVVEEPKNLIERLVAILKKKLGLDTVRDSGIKAKTVRIDAEKRKANEKRLGEILKEFGAMRATYCGTHPCKK